jgi:cell division protease FtsH
VAGLEKKNRVLRREEKEQVAHHEEGHALIALALPGTDPVQKISLIPRGVAALGYTLQLPTEDRFLMTKSELENKIAILLGGRVAEELVYGEISTGAQDDLAKATHIAKNMVKTYGMSEQLGQVSLDSIQPPLFLQAGQSMAKDTYSEVTAREIDAEIRQIIEIQHNRASNILNTQREVLWEAAAVLIRQETITGDELRAIASRANGHLQRERTNRTTIH